MNAIQALHPTEEVEAGYRTGKIYFVNTPLVTISTMSDTSHIHLPNWPIHPRELEPLHGQIRQSLEEIDT